MVIRNFIINKIRYFHYSISSIIIQYFRREYDAIINVSLA